MKITVDVDCTPEEARAFLGLPDVKPMQAQMMAEVQDRMTSALRAMDAQEMMRLWMPANAKAFEQMMEAFTRMTAGRRD